MVLQLPLRKGPTNGDGSVPPLRFTLGQKSQTASVGAFPSPFWPRPPTFDRAPLTVPFPLEAPTGWPLFEPLSCAGLAALPPRAKPPTPEPPPPAPPPPSPPESESPKFGGLASRHVPAKLAAKTQIVQPS